MIFLQHVVLIRCLLMSMIRLFGNVKEIFLFRNKSDDVESLIGIFSLLITEQRFLAAYEDYFNLSEIIEIVHQTTGLLYVKLAD